MSDTNTVSPLRQRMTEDMAARKLGPHTQRGHISSCKRFTAWLKRTPDTATPDEGTPISAAPRRERDEHLQPQSDHDRSSVLVPRHTPSPRSGGRGLAHQGAREAAAGAEPRGGQACPDHGDEPVVVQVDTAIISTCETTRTRGSYLGREPINGNDRIGGKAECPVS